MEKILAAIFTFFKHGLGDYLWDFFALFSFSLESFSRDLEQLTLTLDFQCSARLQEVECGKFYIIVGLISLAFIIYHIYKYRKPNNKKNKKELIIEIISTTLFIFVATSMFYNIVEFSTFFILCIFIGLSKLLARAVK